jgi:hypothetical protein
MSTPLKNNSNGFYLEVDRRAFAIGVVCCADSFLANV